MNPKKSLVSCTKLLATASLLFAAGAPALAEKGEICPAFRWTTLGTAGGPIPTLNRSEPANMLEAAGTVILVDTGDGTADALAQVGREIGEPTHVFISHLHWDHVGGLAAVLGLRWMNGHRDEVTVYGPPGIAQVVEGIVLSLRPQQRVGLGNRAPVADPAANITVVELPETNQQLDIGDLKVTARTNTHFDYPLEEVGTTSLSYRFDLGTRSITYSGDTGPSEALTTLARRTDMLVTEVAAVEPLVEWLFATQPDIPPAMAGPMRQHLSTHHVEPSEVGRMAAEGKVGRVVLTHYAIPSGPLHESEAYLREGVRQHYSGPLDLARDLSSFDVGCSTVKEDASD